MSEEKPKQQSTEDTIKGAGCLILIVLFGGGLLWTQCFGSGDQPFSGRAVNYTVLDSATIDVELELTNEGDEPAPGQCTVEALDVGRFVVGYDLLSSTTDIEPGQSEVWTGSIRIEDNGADRVADINVKDCKQAD